MHLSPHDIVYSTVLTHFLTNSCLSKNTFLLFSSWFRGVHVLSTLELLFAAFDIMPAHQQLLKPVGFVGNFALCANWKKIIIISVQDSSCTFFASLNYIL